MRDLATFDWTARRLIVEPSQTKRSTDFIALLEELDVRYVPKPGLAGKPVVMALDNGPIHTSKAAQAALEARAHWLTIEWLPKYALEQAIIQAVTTMNQEASFQPLATQRISA